MRKLLLAAILVGVVSTTFSGCFSLNWDHNRRHVQKFFDELRALHEDVDRIVFGLERKPTE